LPQVGAIVCGCLNLAAYDGVRIALSSTRKERLRMLETIAVILIVLWLLGMVSGYTIGSFIHLLLVLAVVLFIVRLLSGRRVV
jgi:hypothetical protein